MAATMAEPGPAAEPPQRVWTPGLRRLYAAYAIISAFALGLVVTVGLPFRVADCGPADPLLLRYLGTPFFHSTGTGIPSSLESRLWIGPLLANSAIAAVVIFALNALLRRRPSRRARVPRAASIRIGLGLSVVLMLAVAAVLILANDVQWTFAGPNVDAATCDIRFDWNPDRAAWQGAPE